MLLGGPWTRLTTSQGTGTDRGGGDGGGEGTEGGSQPLDGGESEPAAAAMAKAPDPMHALAIASDALVDDASGRQEPLVAGKSLAKTLKSLAKAPTAQYPAAASDAQQVLDVASGLGLPDARANDAHQKAVLAKWEAEHGHRAEMLPAEAMYHSELAASVHRMEQADPELARGVAAAQDVAAAVAAEVTRLLHLFQLTQLQLQQEIMEQFLQHQLLSMKAKLPHLIFLLIMAILFQVLLDAMEL